MSKIRLLYIIGHLGVGGAENHLAQVLKRLDKNNYQPFVACFQKKGMYLPAVERLGIPVINLVIKRIYNLHGIKKIFSLLTFIRKNKIDIIHSYLLGSNMLGTIVAKLAGIPVIISDRNVNLLLNNRQMLLHKTASRLATVITAVAEKVRLINIEQGIPPDKIVTIYNGVELPKSKTAINILAKKREMGLDPACAVIGTVATLHHRKGHQYLLRAAAKIVSNLPEVQFLLIGDGPLREELENLTERLNLNHKVIFAGHRDDVSKLLPLIDLFVLPSLAEGMSNALLEAMATGLPCVTTDVGGNGEVLLDGVTGFLVPAGDSEKLADAALTLLLNKDMA